jgi:integrase
LSPDGLTWTIPAIRAKNRRAHIVHLAEPARNIIAHLRRRHEAVSAEMAATGSKAPVTDLIFTTTGQTAVSGMSKARRALDPEATEGAEADIGERRSHEGTINAGPDKKTGGAATATDWRFHDFRRTGVSKMAELGIPPHVADRVLNHVSGSIQGVAAVYQRFEFLQERKHAMDVWASHVLSISADKALASNVFPMKRSL